MTAQPSDIPSVDSSETTAPTSARAGRAWKARIAVLAAVLLAAIGGTLTWRNQGAAAAHAQAPPDVPRVQADRIEFSPAFAARIGLRYEAVRVEELVPVIAAVGTAELNPEHVAAVGARLRGLVSRVKKFEGDSVDVGTLLAKIESPELGEAQAAASMLDAQRKVALVNAAREVSLAQRQLTTAKEVETATVEARRASFMLQAAKQKVAALGSRVAASGTSSFGTLELRSPIKGTIVERNVAPGQFVQGDIVAFQIANLDHLWVELDVFERSLGQVRVGDEAELKPMAAASKALIGHVAKIASEIDPETRSAKVRVEVENREHQWRVGQAVKATIHSSGGPAALRTTVRTEAITFVDGKPTVFVMSGPNAVRVVNVHLGAHDDHSTEVLDGIAPSDRVVTDGAFALKGELFR